MTLKPTEMAQCYYLPEQRIVIRFTHKVAHTSLYKALLKAYGADHGRFDPAEVKALKASIDDLLVIGFCRHPLDRLVSCYANKVVGAADLNLVESLGIEPNCSFERFVESLHGTEDEAVDPHCRSQDWHLWGETGVLTHCFRFEQLAASWRAVQHLFRARGQALPEIEHSNASQRRPWRDYFHDPQTLERATSRYARDFERFHY